MFLLKIRKLSFDVVLIFILGINGKVSEFHPH